MDRRTSVEVHGGRRENLEGVEGGWVEGLAALKVPRALAS